MVGKPGFSRQIFLARIQELQAKHNLCTDVAFDQFAGLSNMVGRWKSGNIKIPTLDTLMAVAETFGVSLDWLVGRPGAHHVAENGTPLELPGAILPPTVRTAIKQRVKAYLAGHRLKLPLDQEVRLEVLLEDYYRDTLELPDDQVIKAYLVLCRQTSPEDVHDKDHN